MSEVESDEEFTDKSADQVDKYKIPLKLDSAALVCLCDGRLS